MKAKLDSGQIMKVYSPFDFEVTINENLFEQENSSNESNE